MTTLDEGPVDDGPDAATDDLHGGSSDAEDTLVDVPDADLVADDIALEGSDDVDLLTDGPYAGDRADGADGADAEAEPGSKLVVPPLAAPTSRRQRRAELKASARRVRRVVRHIDPWSVFKVASLFIACIWGVVVLASLLIWRVAVESGSVQDTEDFIVDLGFRDFDFNPEQMFESLLSVGAVMAVAAIFFTVLLTVLFNLICDLTGGVRVTMLEQDQVDAAKRRRRSAPTPDEA